MTLETTQGLKVIRPQGYGIRYAIRTFRTWWYAAWLRTLGRFSRTYLGSFWIGLTNLLSVLLLGFVYGVVFKVKDPVAYFMFLAVGVTIWGFIAESLSSASSLFVRRGQQMKNNRLAPIFFCLEEWAFQLQCFAQALAFVVLVLALIKPTILLSALSSALLPIINLIVFVFWMMLACSMLGACFKDFAQFLPIFLQLSFLVSPILYPKKALGAHSYIADFNPFYRALSPVRRAILENQVSLEVQIPAFFFNLLIAWLLMYLIHRLRYRIALWS
jgi:lipopolysaccharide transport system permease protein